MSSFRIVQYIQPWEIDDFERQVHEVIYSTYDIPKDVTIIWDVTMNTSIVDWTKSSLSKEYFEQKFSYLQNILNFYIKTEFDSDVNIQGCCDKRRICSLKQQDYIIWLDSDMFFTPNILYTLVHSAIQISEEYKTFILTPEIVKFWDSSWDCITNESYLNEPFNYRDYLFDTYSLSNRLITHNIQPSLRKNNFTKFAGGWFNLFTSNIFQKIPVIEEIGAYGPDDTYLMHCSYYLGIPQFILKGCLVSEIGGKYKRNYTKNLLEVTTTDRKRITDEELYALIDKFYKQNNQIY